MPYVQGFVIPVKMADREKFTEFSSAIDAIFLEYGALRVVEAWGVDVPEGQHTDFHRAVAVQPDETVVFSWIEWPDKATCDAAHEQMMKPGDPRWDMEENPPPFDGKRMIFGGFLPVVDITGD